MIQKYLLSLEKSKEIKAAGFPQESYFYWSNAIDKLWRIENRQFFKIDKRRDVAAPTAEEVLNKLPQDLWIDKARYELEIKVWSDKEFCLNYHSYKVKPLIEESQASFEAGIMPLNSSLVEAAAKMLLYLYKNELITLENPRSGEIVK